MALDNVSRIFRSGPELIYALRGVSLRVEPSDYVAITGPSASGKSTLLNLIGCLDRPDGGRYLFAGRDTSELRDRELSRLRNDMFGFVFQSFNLIPDLTVVENVELPLLYGGGDHPRLRALEMLERVAPDISPRQWASDLSGGQQQRVAIARAIVNDPALLLADEPTGSIDAANAEHILALLEQLNSEGVTVVVVTHNHAVASACKRVVRLEAGLVMPERQMMDVAVVK